MKSKEKIIIASNKYGPKHCFEIGTGVRLYIFDRSDCTYLCQAVDGTMKYMAQFVNVRDLKRVKRQKECVPNEYKHYLF